MASPTLLKLCSQLQLDSMKHDMLSQGMLRDNSTSSLLLQYCSQFNPQVNKFQISQTLGWRMHIGPTEFLSHSRGNCSPNAHLKIINTVLNKDLASSRKLSQKWNLNFSINITGLRVIDLIKTTFYTFNNSRTASSLLKFLMSICFKMHIIFQKSVDNFEIAHKTC